MKFILFLILTLLFIDSVLGCRPVSCQPGYYRKCEPRPAPDPKTRLRNPCYFLSGCRCVKKEGNEDLIKNIIKPIASKNK